MLLNAFLAKLLIVLFGYLLPAYKSYKALSASNNPAGLKVWCQYWVVLAAFLSAEWLADATVSWLPLYNEAKVLFVVYLWHPRTRGVVAVYERFLQPMLRQHEAQIDSSMEEAKARIADNVTWRFKRARDMAMSNASSIMDSIRSFSEDPRGQQQQPQLHLGQQPQRRGVTGKKAAKGHAA